MDPQTANSWLDAHFSPLVRGLGLRVEQMACTGAILSMPVAESSTAPDGIIATPALTALAETAMAIACAGHFREWRAVTATNIEMQLLQPARGESLDCTATVVRGSKTLVFTRALITAEPSGKEVAAVTATWIVG